MRVYQTRISKVMHIVPFKIVLSPSVYYCKEIVVIIFNPIYLDPSTCQYIFRAPVRAKNVRQFCAVYKWLIIHIDVVCYFYFLDMENECAAGRIHIPSTRNNRRNRIKLLSTNILKVKKTVCCDSCRGQSVNLYNSFTHNEGMNTFIAYANVY